MINKPTIDAVPLEEALIDIRKYKNFMKDHFKLEEKQILKAFTIHSVELLEAMGIDYTSILPQYPSVRVYIGKKDGDEDEAFKLFLVPVDENGKDVILKGPFKNLLATDEYVFDFTMPCPNTCDDSSPLANA
ncbi:hypothetical protein [Pedobacter gandavensis]|uniref:hypothetical protein n=1 Tax=Pedobacter gandavensis TaxID=2679963 RepID=UPI00292F5677|nr:hypothetical protein [Pedobacter gandavensis]